MFFELEISIGDLVHFDGFASDAKLTYFPFRLYLYSATLEH